MLMARLGELTAECSSAGIIGEEEMQQIRTALNEHAKFVNEDSELIVEGLQVGIKHMGNVLASGIWNHIGIVFRNLQVRQLPTHMS